MKISDKTDMKRAIGILGGMGPLATCDLMEKIIRYTNASTDQEYPHVYVDCNTSIPDRSKAILYNGESPIPCMLESGKKLKNMGADFIVISCNTAHYFMEELKDVVGIPILNMIEETAKALSTKNVKKVGLLATTGTIKTGLYNRELAKYGIDVIIPSEEEQLQVMEMIYEEVKASSSNSSEGRILKIVDKLMDEGAELIILGCTEIPLIWEKYSVNRLSINPTSVLAHRAVEIAGYKVKESEKLEYK